MLRRERLSSDMVCNHYSPELPSPVISGGTYLTGSCGAFFIQYRSHGAKLETVSRWEGDHLLSGIGSTRMDAIGLAEAPVPNQPLSLHVVGIMAGHSHNGQGNAKGSYQRYRGSESQIERGWVSRSFSASTVHQVTGIANED